MNNDQVPLETEQQRAAYAADQLKIMKNPSGALAREYLRLVALLEKSSVESND